MKEIRKIDSMKVRAMCIRDKYYTCGTNKEYNHLLNDLCDRNKNITLEDIEEIAADILIHSVWEEKTESYGCNYDELLANVMGSLINECCCSYIQNICGGESEKEMTKKMISELNAIAQEDFEKAQSMLEGINMVLGTQYGWLAKRVVFFDNPNGNVAEKYAAAHDAWCYAE